MLTFFFFNDTATTEIYTLSLHDALPISPSSRSPSICTRAPPPGPSASGFPKSGGASSKGCVTASARIPGSRSRSRSEEHTSELQSRLHLVCRLLLEKKKKTT